MNLHKFFANAVVFAGFVAIPFIPFIILGNSTFFPFIVGKNFAFRAVVEVMFSAWVVLAVIDPAYRPKKGYILGAFVALLAVITLSGIFGENTAKSFWSNFERMEGVVTYFHLFAYFVVASTVLTVRGFWKQYIDLLLSAGVIMAVYGVLQWAGVLTVVQDGVRVNGTLGNAAYLGTYALVNIFIAALVLVKKNSMPIIEQTQGFIFAPVFAFLVFLFFRHYFYDSTLHQVISFDVQHTFSVGALVISFIVIAVATFWMLSQERMRAAIAATIIILQTFVLYHTATRGAVLGLIVGAGIATLLIAIFEKNNKVVRGTAVGALVAVILFVGGFIAMRNAPFVQQSPVLARFAAISLTEQTTKSRFMVWNMAWQGFKERPVLGWGMENFNYVFNKYYDPKMYNQEQWFDRAHNVFFDWLIAGGLPALLAYLALFVSALYYIWKRTDELSIIEKSILTGLLGGYFFQNLFVFDNLTSLMYFGTILAYVEGVRRHEKVVSEHKKAKLVSKDSEDLTFMVSGGAILLAIVLVYMVNYNGFIQNATLIRSLERYPEGISTNLALMKQTLAYDSFGTSEAREQLGQVAMSGLDPSKPLTDVQKEFITLAGSELEKQAAELPNDARYQVFAGSFMARLGNIDKGISYLERAAQLSPKKQAILFELGSAYYNSKQTAKAEDVFKKAFELAPEYPDAEKYYLQVLVLNGKKSVAQQVLKDHPLNGVAI